MRRYGYRRILVVLQREGWLANYVSGNANALLLSSAIRGRLQRARIRDGLRVKQVLERLKEARGLPASITGDNGPEFAWKVLDAWAYEAGVMLSFIRPGHRWRTPTSKASTGGSAMNA